MDTPLFKNVISVIALTVGVSMMALGTLYILLIFAFASLVDPSLAGSAWWSEVLGKMAYSLLRGGEMCVATALVLVGGGLGMLAGFMCRTRQSVEPG